MHEFGAGTHVGNLRDNNEDSYVCDPDNELWIVADGMGGLGLGEVASAISTYTVAQHVKQGHGINQAIEIAHNKIKEYAEQEARGTNMGTTMVLLLTHGSLYNVFWVGDSRGYLFDNGQLKQLTTDHSLVQSLIDQGEITPEEAISDPRKNVVTRALGVQEMETVRADSISEKWQPGQKILLCSDGLTDCVRTDQITAILNREISDQEKVDLLIQAALDGGGNDNITIVLVSAAKHISRPDSDTHVPGETSDSTLVPGPDSTERGHRYQASPQTDEQVNTAESPEHLSSERLSSKKEAQNNFWRLSAIRNWLAGAFAVVVLVVFARLTTADKQEPQDFRSSQLLALNTPASAPVGRRGMPDIEMPTGGSVIQLGLFNRLSGAESKQQELARLGYVPYIEKKVVSDTIQYAVLLGPYHDATESERVSDALIAADISHFERPEIHY